MARPGSPDRRTRGSELRSCAGTAGTGSKIHTEAEKVNPRVFEREEINMGSTPRGLYLKPGAAILTAPLPGGAPVFANPGDAIVSANGGGWHICIAPHAVPVEGLTPGASGDHFHWSQGPSYSGQGVPSLCAPDLRCGANWLRQRWSHQRKWCYRQAKLVDNFY